MSEQEKKETIPTEGTVTEVKEEKSKIRKWLDSHPKAVKWAKRIGTGILWAGSAALAYMAGKGSASMAADCCCGACADCTDDDEDEEETAE